MAETQAGYWARKRAELALLASYAGGGDGATAPATGAELVAAKQRLRAAMLAAFHRASPALTESNLTARLRIDAQPAGIAYKYQRFDVSVTDQPFAARVYPQRWSKRHVSTGVLTSSGMAAVTIALGALDHDAAPGTALVLPSDSYFETYRYATTYLHTLTVVGAGDAAGAPARVIYLDSSVAGDPTRGFDVSVARGAHAVVFDTTCYPNDSDAIYRVVDACLAARVPCVLVRSHLKLDCLATEYGRLGSIVVIVSRSAGEQALRFTKQLKNRVMDMASRVGGLFVPAALFPAAADPDFRALNGRRLQRIQRTNLTAATALARSASRAARIRRYHHGMFFTVEPRTEAIRDRWIDRLDQLMERLAEVDIEARVAPSFGHDIATVSGYAEMPANRWVLRFALPDWYDHLRRELCRVTSAWLKG